MIAGKVTEFIRVGDDLLRPATANSEAMRQVLAHLEESLWSRRACLPRQHLGQLGGAGSVMSGRSISQPRAWATASRRSRWAWVTTRSATTMLLTDWV